MPSPKVQTCDVIVPFGSKLLPPVNDTVSGAVSLTGFPAAIAVGSELTLLTVMAMVSESLRFGVPRLIIALA